MCDAIHHHLREEKGTKFGDCIHKVKLQKKNFPGQKKEKRFRCFFFTSNRINRNGNTKMSMRNIW